MNCELSSFLSENRPLNLSDYIPSTENYEFIVNDANILIIGAGGLGCEIIKIMAMMGCSKISVIDMDTIDLSNLNRQFLFRDCDIGKSKAEAAAAAVRKRVPSCQITAHFKRIEDFDLSFYRQFHIIIGGLDSITARRWINGMLHELLRYDENGELIQSSIIPFVDGGTEGLKGNARLIIPGISACFDCNLDLFPPQVKFPLCTLAHTPRLPEHCIEYAKVVLWPEKLPFGQNVDLDGDDPEHVQWIFQQSCERALKYRISGVTYRLTLGVIKNIIPAVASTNTVIAAICCSEAFKLLSSAYASLDNFVFFNSDHGLYSYSFQSEKSPNCPTCDTKPYNIKISKDVTVVKFAEYLKESSLKLLQPTISANIDGVTKIIHTENISSVIDISCLSYADKTLSEVLIEDSILYVLDKSSPKVFRVIINWENSE